MTPEDPSLAPPELPPLAQPVGPLDFWLSREIDPDDDHPFAVAGLRACVTGGAVRGADLVRIHPIRLARGPRLRGATTLGASITPPGVERTLQVGGSVVVERLVVPRDGQFCLFEWEAARQDAPADLVLEWHVGLEPESPGAESSRPLRWRQVPGGLVVAGADPDRRAIFVLGGQPYDLMVDDPTGEGATIRVVARITVPAGSSVRLALLGEAGAGDPGLARALRTANRGRALVLARLGALDRLARERLSLESPDPTLDRGLAWAQVRLGELMVEVPGAGRSLVPGYGSGPLTWVTAPAVEGALDCLVLGDFDTPRQVLAFLGEHQRSTGYVPGACYMTGGTVPGRPSDSWLYLLLAGRYLAWTGDIPFVQTQWPRVLRALHALQQGERPVSGEHDRLRTAALAELVRAAETLGADAVAATLLREPGADQGAEPGAEAGAGMSAGGSEAVARFRALLGVEPDATRGRLVLKPRPPATWEGFTVRALAMGDAAVMLAYARKGGVHRFTVRQERGVAPLRLIMEPELVGRFRAARVDGATAELGPIRAQGWAGGTEDRVRVPVQLALDHERVLDVELET